MTRKAAMQRPSVPIREWPCGPAGHTCVWLLQILWAAPPGPAPGLAPVLLTTTARLQTILAFEAAQNLNKMM